MERRGRVVLVAVDLTTYRADPLLAALEQVGGSVQGTIHLLNVRDRAKHSETRARSMLAQDHEYLATMPALLLERMRTVAMSHARLAPRAKISAHARIGPVVEVILQACVDYDVDLLICGTHARTGLARMVEGSVAEALMQSARCPVLVARRKSYCGLQRTPASDSAPKIGARLPPVLTARAEGPVASATLHSWERSDSGLTGFRFD